MQFKNSPLFWAVFFLFLGGGRQSRQKKRTAAPDFDGQKSQSTITQ
jgi:hypothetical protein